MRYMRYKPISGDWKKYNATVNLGELIPEMQNLNKQS